MAQDSRQAGALYHLDQADIDAAAIVLVESGLMKPEADMLSHLLVRNILRAALGESPRAEHAAECALQAR